MIAGPVVERAHLNLTVGLQLLRFAPDHPEGVRVTQETGRYRISDEWETQGVALYTRAVPGVSYPGRDHFLVEFEEKLYQSAPGWLSTSVALRINGCTYFRRRPVQFYVREPCGLPSGQALWEDPFTEGASWLLTVETLEVTSS